MMHSEQPCAQQLEDLQKEYEEFAYIVSHDLKAPLRAISNLSAWIAEDLGDDLSPDVEKNIQLLQKRADRMERMINGLLEFSRVPRFDLEVREVNVTQLVQQASDRVRQNHALEIHASSLPTLTTYGKKLETVFFHLLQNAATYTQHENPQVWISATEEENAFLFQVKDNGMGMKEETLDKVFKMFYSAQAKDQHDGLGVGLSLVKKIVQFAGGTISVTSTLGAGTEFQFFWPKTVQ
ncbi:ATP-binding protein [Rufibacter sediminis]|uniref:histidine kinase n=1 Tax=Rufibacter sediminis TaxID=2762756 RepID=A0ABR6VLM4_9BACT|nr:HAMP domain-containing sensor histidine kinase [Rufibacter sediminis]MBC3538128.1 HAMP domain-containing histidine kinase [Rufibacter sediminis]